MKTWVWQGKPWQAFKTFATIFSFTINLILIVVLLLVAPQIIPTVDTVAEPLVGGLNESFVQMGEATILQTIQVDDRLPISFTLNVSDTTAVVLTQPVPLTAPATFVLPGGGGAINGVVSLNLPVGLRLPIALRLAVPVEQTIPVKLAVPVDIPLDETELGVPFGRLQLLFDPLDGFITGLPSSNNELIDRALRSTSATPPRFSPNVTARPPE